MTEHKMTAKGFMHKKFQGLIEAVSLENFEEEKVFTVDEVESMLKEFALQVATEAVEDEIESYDRGFGKLAAKMHGESILKNIKKRLNDE